MYTFFDYYIATSASIIMVMIIGMLWIDWTRGPNHEDGYYFREATKDNSWMWVPYHTWLLLACAAPPVNIITAFYLAYHGLKWLFFIRRVNDFVVGTAIVPNTEIDVCRISYLIAKGLVELDAGRDRIQISSLVQGVPSKVFPKEYFIIENDELMSDYVVMVHDISTIERKVFVQFGTGPIVDYDADTLVRKLQYKDDDLTLTSAHSLIKNIYDYITTGARPVTLEKHYG